METSRFHCHRYKLVEPVDLIATSFCPRRHGCMMSLRVTSTYKTYLLFSCFFGLPHERNPHNKNSRSSSRSSTGSCASRDDTKTQASVNSEDYRDRRCIARSPLLGRSKPHSRFLVQRMLCWQLALFCIIFSEQA